VNRSGHLEDLGIENDAGELGVFNSWAKKVGSHRSVDGGNILSEIVFEDHVIPYEFHVKWSGRSKTRAARIWPGEFLDKIPGISIVEDQNRVEPEM
jgi:hypothetical protein